MLLNQRQVNIVNELYNAHLDLARGTDEQRRELTQMIDEQICFELGSRWGMKARTGGSIANASKDAIGYLEDNGLVSVWDWQNGATREPQVRAGQPPDYPNLPIDEAIFIMVNPVNHLNSEGGNGENNGDIEEVISKLDAIQQQLDSMEQQLVALLMAVQELSDKTTKFPITYPTYSGRLGVNLRLIPEPPQNP